MFILGTQDPALMTGKQRWQEVAKILAVAIERMLTRQKAQSQLDLQAKSLASGGQWW